MIYLAYAMCVASFIGGGAYLAMNGHEYMGVFCLICAGLSSVSTGRADA